MRMEAQAVSAVFGESVRLNTPGRSLEVPALTGLVDLYRHLNVLWAREDVML